VNQHLDHVIWACNDLAAGSARFEALTGVRPRYGGVHASGLTHNALVGLGGRCYLEILAPTGPPAEAGGSGFADDDWCRFARASATPRLFTYCMRSVLPLAEVATMAESMGCSGSAVAGNGRTTPEGVRLRWQWVGPRLQKFDRAFPFFIDWLDSPHPAESFAAALPRAGITLTRFAVGHPDATDLRRILGGVTTPIEVYDASELEFALELATPRGAVTL
jgi:hypothetical protein